MSRRCIVSIGAKIHSVLGNVVKTDVFFFFFYSDRRTGFPITKNGLVRRRGCQNECLIIFLVQMREHKLKAFGEGSNGNETYQWKDIYCWQEQPGASSTRKGKEGEGDWQRCSCQILICTYVRHTSSTS